MKRFAMMIGLSLVLLAIPTFAQNLSLGIVGGANWTDIKITTDGVEEDVSAHLRYGAGGVLSLHMSDTYSIEVAPMFLRLSSRMDQEGGQNPDFDMRYNYLQVPLFFKLSSRGAMRTYVKAGPVVGVLLKAETEIELNDVVFTGDFSHALKTLDLGLGVGLGVEFPVGKGNLFFEGRYVLGLNDVLEGGTIQFEGGGITMPLDIPGNTEAKSRSVQVMMGYSIPLGGK